MTGLVDDVQRIGVARLVGQVRAAEMRRTAVEDDQCARLRFGRQLQMFRPGCRIHGFRLEAEFARAVVALPQRRAVCTGNEMHAAVLDRRILEREPEADTRLRFGVDVGGILVADDLTADARRLENVHGLDDARFLESEARCNLGKRFRMGEAIEYGIDVMHRMSHLVQGVFLGLPQPAVVFERIDLEEEANLVSRFDEIAIVQLLVVGRREDAPDVRRIEGVDEFAGSFAQCVAVRDALRSLRE